MGSLVGSVHAWWRGLSVAGAAGGLSSDTFHTGDGWDRVRFSPGSRLLWERRIAPFPSAAALSPAVGISSLVEMGRWAPLVSAELASTHESQQDSRTSAFCQDHWV